MEKNVKAIIVFAVLVVLTAFLGIPIVWKPWLSAIFGLVVVILAYRLLRGNVSSKQKNDITSRGEPLYVERQPAHEQDDHATHTS